MVSYFAVICDGELTMISGLPLYKVMFPDTDTVRPAYAVVEKTARHSMKEIKAAVNA